MSYQQWPTPPQQPQYPYRDQDYDRKPWPMGPRSDNYTVVEFLWDCLIVTMTCGFGLIWVFCREMRRRTD